MQARRQEGFKGIQLNLYFGLQRFYTPPNFVFCIFYRLYLTAILVQMSLAAAMDPADVCGMGA